MRINVKTFVQLLGVICLTGFLGVLLMSCKRTVNFEGTPDGWLGYWGGIFGSVIGVIGALLVLREQINVEKVDNTFFNLLTIHNEAIDRLRSIVDEKGKDIFFNIHKSMNENKEQFMQDEELRLKIEYVNKNKANFLNVIKSMKTRAESLSVIPAIELLTYNEQLINKYIEELNDDLNHYGTDIESKLNSSVEFGDITPLDELYSSIVSDRYSLILSECRQPFEEFTRLYDPIAKIQVVDIGKGSKDTIIEKSLDEYYWIIGSYFRVFHRIIKYINENVKDSSLRSDYIGFLRAMINEKEMIVIFYNAFYSKRGEGLADQLKYTDFFGKLDELPIKGTTVAQHFNQELLLWYEDDIKIMQELSLLKNNKFLSSKEKIK